jgi:hypothetical protein
MYRAGKRTLLCLGLALISCAQSNAQSVVLTIDYSNLSAVTVTATGNSSAIDYPHSGSGNYTFNDGIALLGFFTNPVTVTDFVGANTSSTLTDSANNATSNTTFNVMSSWNDAHPEYWSSYGATNTETGSDITLWNLNSGGAMNFSISSAAFNGQAVFDLSGYSSFTSLFPALNATGNIEIWNNDGGIGSATLGTWKVVGVSAVPEPTTYAALFGLTALAVASWRRRQQKQA